MKPAEVVIDVSIIPSQTCANLVFSDSKHDPFTVLFLKKQTNRVSEECMFFFF